MNSNNNSMINNDQIINKRSHKHLHYIPWEPTRAAVSRTQQMKSIPLIPEQTISTQLYRYQNNSKCPSPLPSSTMVIGKEMINIGNKVKPTATVEPFQASINVDEILYGIRPSSPTNYSSSDLNLSNDQQELKNELDRVQEENAGLKQQLEIQTQVNAELKKLLVASIGTDFQYRLERLLRDKSRYEIEIQILTRKINDLFEEIEKLTILCDIYQSKLAGSRVLIDELNMHKSVLSVQYNDCTNVIQRLLGERSKIAKELIQVHSSLSLLNEIALNNNRKHLSISPKFDLIQLSSYIQTLALSLYNYLKQTIFHQQINHRQLSIQLELTETETCALEILQSHTSVSSSLQTSTNTIDKSVNDIEQLETMINRLKLISKKKSHERFHLTTRYENLTFNCCRDCSGEIYVV
ncbi:unnamed protein product [Rotaria sordida]|uniref:Uncharacterized protein n=1 Tax=Rotaria sordida TaxID=392033 RepID=A0A814QAW6_9BILA|nr:unnamed protein product [Rotaria sordida]CAF1116664.1 unnamed protein product [Rotaria sordida]CAF1176402.1 unnamed protein product [Rotaria sordida]CAF1181190.1 unnamed protein product [Rotaria sordida]CAF3749959.1 unnamed protein product [Rotaria sordida]